MPGLTNLRRQLALVVALQLFAAIILGGPFLATGTLANDREADFCIFRDTLHALNVHGEFPWWNPSMQAGFPFYYTNLVVWPGREPLFEAMKMGAWLLGRSGVTIGSYVAIYVGYFAFLVPLLLSLSVLALAREMFRRPLAVYAVIVLMAFSPGVVFSLSDLGTELTPYGFFFAAAWLRFLRRPSTSSFLLACLPALAMAAGLTYVELFWNLVFVPAFVVFVSVGRRGLTGRSRRAIRTVPGRWWVAAAAGLFLCALPTLVAYGHGADILSSATGARTYGYAALRPGTALEALALSTPGVGFEWTDYASPKASFQAHAISKTSGYNSYGYLGMLTLPLACLGLVVGRPYWSIRLYAGIGGGMLIVLLSAYSPVFSLLLGPKSPLLAVNHYSDITFRVGLYALFVLAAGLGVESLLQSRPSRRLVLAGLFFLTSAASVAWLVALQGARATDNYLFGVTLALIMLYGVGLARLVVAGTQERIRSAVGALLVLTVLDVSTLAFSHYRLTLVGAAPPVSEPDAATVGSVEGKVESGHLHLRGVDLEPLANAPATGPATLVDASTGVLLSDQDVEIGRRTYNSISMRVRAAAACRLEWRDAYFPFWRAWVNGIEVPIDRTSRGMKAVHVPAGESSVVFRFSPTVLRATVAAGDVTLAVAAMLWLLVRRRSRVSSAPGPREKPAGATTP
jgi:hypothetical protein